MRKHSLLFLLTAVIFTFFLGLKPEGRPDLSSLKKYSIIPPPISADNNFVNIIFNGPYSPSNEPRWLNANFDNYNELNFTGIHAYDDFKNQGTERYGKFQDILTPGQIYSSDSLISSVTNSGMDFLWERVKISRLCYGQRLEYEVPSDGTTQTNYGFCYQNYSGELTTDSGRTVVHACPSNCASSDATPRYILNNIYENLQHTDLGYEFDLQSHDTGVWYMKPMMRIDSAIVDNNPTTPVVRIVAVNFNGDTIKSTTILAGNFGNSGNYAGQYIDHFFNLASSALEVQGTKNDPSGLAYGRSTNWTEWDENCAVDFKVYWFGQVEVWFDKMTVDDETANQMFDPNPLVNHDSKIEEELDNWDNENWNFTYFADELVHSNIPCVKYVLDKMQSHHGSPKLQFATSNYLNVHGMKNNNLENRPMMEVVQPDIVSVDIHEVGFPQWLPPAAHFQNVNTGIVQSEWFKNASDYNDYLQERVFGDKGSRGLEDDMYSAGTYYIPSWGATVYQLYMGRNMRDLYSPETKFIAQPQLHGIFYPDSQTGNITGFRESTNEEIRAQGMLSIAHGADGLCWYTYESYHESSSPLNVYVGMQNDSASGYTKRTSNLYGQNKWDSVAVFNEKIKLIKPTLDIIKWDTSFCIKSEVSAQKKYIDDIKSVPLDPFEVFDLQNEDTEKYWDVGFFNPDPSVPSNQGDHSKYFLMVNRRCIPKYPHPYSGDVRQLRIKFNGAHLGGFNNWKLIDVETGNLLLTFDKNSTAYHTITVFEPGEGKLFKVVPVMQEGGEFVANEFVNANVICKDTVYNDGYNLDISIPTVIEFKAAGKIIMDGGSFFCGYHPGNGEDDITLKGNGSDKWTGILLDGCDTVKVDNTIIQNVEDYDPPITYYGFDIINCSKVTIWDNTFTGYNTGGVRCNYTSASGVNILIEDNIFTMNDNNSPVVYVSANSSMSLPVIIDGNDFTVSSSSSSQAIIVNNISGAVIKNNVITDYKQSILALSSSIDLYNNQITTSSDEYAISGTSGSNLNMKPSLFAVNGGFNTIITSDDDANNVEVSGSYFLVDGGDNTFDISGSYDDGKHFTGYFPGSSESPYYIDYNCFTFGSSKTDPVADVTWGFEGEPVTFFREYDCESGEGAGHSSKTPHSTGQAENNYLIVPITDEYNDTILIRSGSGDMTTSDSMFIEMRKRNYGIVIDLSKRILEDDPGSPVAYDAVSKLYLASLRLDSAGSKMTPLKAFLEEVILDNGDKPGLVSRAFYFIQKCKAALGQYQSALTGFSDIVTNNPNTYDALVASWDYAATTLLLNGGQGGGDKPMFGEEELFVFHSFIDDPKDQPKLKEMSDRGDRNATKELKRRETLQAVVTKRQPADIYEHINNVSSDIRVVFNSTDDNSIKKEQNSLPVEFELSQNFPNPFNPTTKIQYALPKDGKVQLVIYDILGREMAKLVNNEFKPAGRHVSEFNGSRLASGIYFYRIIVNDGKDFNSVKKMVLVK
jgi:hypothetical protein